MRRYFAALAISLGSLLMTFCQSPEAPQPVPPPDTLNILGTFNDDFGFTHIISNDYWATLGSGHGGFEIIEVHTQSLYLLAQNSAKNDFNPSLYSRFEWTTPDSGSFSYCQSAYDAASLDTSRPGTLADKTNLTSGCAGFPWSLLSPVPMIEVQTIGD